jgi:MYXO-CTERM domain-containing protein
MPRWFGSWLVPATVALGLAPVARATPPCECVSLGVLPPDGATGVPTNVRIFVPLGGFVATEVSLYAEMDPLHPMSLGLVASGGTLRETWLVPETELAPDTRYVVDLPDPLTTVSFTTGGGTDVVAPHFDAVTVEGGALSGDCAEHAAAVVTADGLTDDVVPVAGLLLRVVVDDPSTGAAARIVWLQGSSGTFGEFSAPDWQTCLHNFPGISTVRTFRAVVTALDWSGNESSPSAAADFRFQDNGAGGGCSCNAPGGRSTSWLGLAALAAVLALRLGRRRRS